MDNYNPVLDYIDKNYPTAIMVPASVLNPLCDILDYSPSKSLMYTPKRSIKKYGLVYNSKKKEMYVVDGDIMIPKSVIKEMKLTYNYPDTINLLIQHWWIHHYIEKNLDEINKILHG